MSVCSPCSHVPSLELVKLHLTYFKIISLLKALDEMPYWNLSLAGPPVLWGRRGSLHTCYSWTVSMLNLTHTGNAAADEPSLAKIEYKNNFVVGFKINLVNSWMCCITSVIFESILKNVSAFMTKPEIAFWLHDWWHWFVLQNELVWVLYTGGCADR